MTNVTRTERGWGAHFVGASNCAFRRNTLLEREETRIIISTVGNYYPIGNNSAEQIGHGRYYETMVWFAAKEGVYWDADVVRGEIQFSSPWAVRFIHEEADAAANSMHEVAVDEMTRRLLAGENIKSKKELYDEDDL